MASPLAALFGCAGPVLSAAERRFFRDADPAGFILFARNVIDPPQVRALVFALRDSVGRAAPVLIDQEGGRVQRLKPPYWTDFPPARLFGDLWRRDPEKGVAAAYGLGRVLASELSELGITVDCAPVADIPTPGAHDVIGDRAFGLDAECVIATAGAVSRGLLDGGVIPVVKHMPGHGRATADSHLELPVVAAGRSDLDASDFLAFRKLAGVPWAMTAHVVYEALDPACPATLSPRVIDGLIRRDFGYQGVVVSDDLSMKALGGRLADRAGAALAAGCDLVLHCNGDMTEMVAVASGARPVSAHGAARLLHAESRRAQAVPDPRETASFRTLLRDVAAGAPAMTFGPGGKLSAARGKGRHMGGPPRNQAKRLAARRSESRRAGRARPGRRPR